MNEEKKKKDREQSLKELKEKVLLAQKMFNQAMSKQFEEAVREASERSKNDVSSTHEEGVDD